MILANWVTWRIARQRRGNSGQSSRRPCARGRQAHKDGAAIVDGVLAESVGKLAPAELAELHRLLLRAAADTAVTGQ